MNSNTFFMKTCLFDWGSGAVTNLFKLHFIFEINLFEFKDFRTGYSRADDSKALPILKNHAGGHTISLLISLQYHTIDMTDNSLVRLELLAFLMSPDLFYCLELSQEPERSLGSSVLVWHLEWLWHGLFCFPIPKIIKDLNIIYALIFPLKWSSSRHSYGCHSYVAHKIIEDPVDLPGCGDMVIVDSPFGFALLWSDCFCFGILLFQSVVFGRQVAYLLNKQIRFEFCRSIKHSEVFRRKWL